MTFRSQMNSTYIQAYFYQIFHRCAFYIHCSHMVQSQKSKPYGIYATAINVKIEVKVSHTFLISILSYHLGQASLNFIHCSIVLSWIHAVFDWGSTVLLFSALRFVDQSVFVFFLLSNLHCLCFFDIRLMIISLVFS